MFYDVFLKLLEENKVSQTQAMNDIGMSRTSIMKWKKGAIPSGATLNKLAEYFDVSVDYLLTGEDPNLIADAYGPQLDHFMELYKGDSASAMEAYQAFKRAEAEDNQRSAHQIGKTDEKNKPDTVNDAELTPDELEFIQLIRKMSPEQRKQLEDFAEFQLNK